MRRSLAVAILAVAVLAAACTKDEDVSSPSPATPSTGASQAIGANQYGWDAYGVTAVLTPTPGTWRLKITNHTGTKIDAPGIYALAADDGHRIDATVEGAEALADGESGTLEVAWPSDFDNKNVGMVMLMVGEDLYGGFLRG